MPDASAADYEPLEILFLGDNGPHQPPERFKQLAPVMADRGIQLTYTDDMRSLNSDTLGGYDGLIIYANIERIEPAQEQTLLDYVADGHAFIPLHCASYCFLNSEKYVELVGAQFQRHGTGVFRVDVVRPDHPIMRGYEGFESWDETYVHHRHNQRDRLVLEIRTEGDQQEPWTWVRTHGKGRVFYTAWGHDQRTWSKPGFHDLVERGIRWAVGGDQDVAGTAVDRKPFDSPAMTPKRPDVAPFEYIDVGAKIPNYPPSKKWGVQEKPLTQMQLPLPPEESIKHFVTPVGFKTELFASEPQLGGKPIAMAWDERGRLWVCETYDYPNELQRPGRGRDRIRICEDTDRDGRADKFTVFAEELSIPTAIAFYRGGAIVQNGTETLYLKDTDGDDVADERRVLFTGWNMTDTHGGVSNFQYGLDNWIWAMQGYNNSRPVVAGQQQQAFRMGFFRFRPDGSELEFIRSTDNNTWGLGISEEGIIFGSTANHNPSVYMPIANRYYERVRGWAPSQLKTIADTHLFKPITDRVRQVDHHGGYTAGAGHALYTARNYPQPYWNRTAFVCGPTGHLVGTFVLNPVGADFKSTSPMNLLASDDEWTAPIQAEVGPDGNVWVIDWYNYIVQHNPTPAGFKTGDGNAYETELRDKKHGRIYRVVYHGQGSANQPSEMPNLHDSSPEQLVATLKHPNMFWRKHAQRLLVERGELDVAPELIELALDKSVDEIGLNVGAIHALWTLHGLDAFDGDAQSWGAYGAAISALQHPSAGVRRNAALVLPPNEKSAGAILDSGMLDDADAQVRLAALLALADMPRSTRAAQSVATLLTNPAIANDAWLPDAAISAAATNDLDFLRHVATQASSDVTPKLVEAASIVSEHFARRAAVESVGSLLEILPQADSEIAATIIEGLAAGWPKDNRPELSAADEQHLIDVLNRLPGASKGQLIKLASQWDSDALKIYSAEIAASLLATVTDEQAETSARVAAARQLVELRSADDTVIRLILKHVTPQASPDLATGLIESLRASTSENAGSQLVAAIPTMTPAARQAAIRVLLGRPATTLALLDGVSSGKLQLADLTLDQKQALSAHPSRQIAARAKALLARGGGLPNPDREKVLQELLPLTERSGDVLVGKEIFKKQCSKCHTHSGEGQKIGPDLTGMAVHPKRELLTQIIDPSRSVEGNYRTYTVITVEGRIFTGMLAGETRTSIEIVDAEAKRHTILREDIDELLASPKSLMPEGFEKQLQPDEIVNLLEFMAHRGQYTPLDLRGAATIVSTRGMFYDEASRVERLIFPDWTLKTFAGVPFVLIDPQGDRVPNVVMLYSPNGKFPPEMPRRVELPVNQPASAIHMLSGVGGWSAKSPRSGGSVSMIVRLNYADGTTEDHELRDGEHFADYIGPFEVPKSQLAFRLRGQQIRYLAVEPQRRETIESLELIKGPDRTAPIVMAITVEAPQ